MTALLVLGVSGARAQEVPVPLNVRALSSERGGVLVAWERPTFGLVLYYDVYRATRAGSRGSRIARSVVGEEYVDTAAAVNRTYYYSVRSVDVDGNASEPSVQVQVFVRDLVPPAPPHNVRVRTRDPGEVHVSWSKPSGEKIVSYVVYRSQSPGVLGDRRIQTSKTSYTEYALMNGETHYYSVVAMDSGGNRSVESNAVEAVVTNTRDLPLAVSDSQAHPTGKSGEVRVSWSRPSSSNFSHANIYRSESPGSRGSLIAENVRGSRYTDRGLADGMVYYYTIESVSRGGASYESVTDLSAAPFVAARARAAPPAPTRARAQDIGDGRTIRLSWVNPEAGSYRAVRIYRSEDAAELGELIASNVRASSYTDAGVAGDTRYFYTVVTVGTNGIESLANPAVGGIATLALAGEGAGVDSDADGLPDSWERHYSYHARVGQDPNQDDDADGLPLSAEYRHGTNPWDPDSDDDGYTDGTEVANGYSPVGPGRLESRPDAARIIGGAFAYGRARLGSLAEEASAVRQLKRLLEEEFGPGAVPNPRSHWPKLVNAYVYGGYDVSEIAHTVQFGPGLVHPEIPADVWRQSSEYSRRRGF